MRYRKKPDVIEAVAWNGEYSGPGEWPDWFNEALRGIRETIWINQDNTLSVRTTNGIERADIGDIIIQGVRGDLYPLKRASFDLIYESDHDA